VIEESQTAALCTIARNLGPSFQLEIDHLKETKHKKVGENSLETPTPSFLADATCFSSWKPKKSATAMKGGGVAVRFSPWAENGLPSSAY
jgi:hypothetical protein